MPGGIFLFKSERRIIVMENKTINLDQLTQPLPSNGSTTSSIIDRFNTVFSGQWSFRIIENKVRDSEVIVLGELSANGAVRQQFGKALIDFNSDPTGTPSMADHLIKAADDALVQCAYAYGIQRVKDQSQPDTLEIIEISDEPAPQSKKNENGISDRPLTNRQLAAIFGLGKANNLTQQEIITMTTELFGSEPSELNVSQASTIISELSENTGKE
jgi:hypothetical protein